jgi:hypothetical protein
MRTRQIALISAILLANLLFLSCAPMGAFITIVSSDIVSFKDPSYRDVSFGRILVRADYQKLDAVQKIESRMVQLLNNEGVYAIASSTILPPIREYTEDERNDAILAANIDSYIIISEIRINKDTVFVPPVSTTQTNTVTSRRNAYETTTSYTSPGYDKELIWSIETKAELYDFQNRRIVWKGETNTANTFDGYSLNSAKAEDIFESFCKKIVEELRNNSLLK